MTEDCDPDFRLIAPFVPVLEPLRAEWTRAVNEMQPAEYNASLSFYLYYNGAI